MLQEVDDEDVFLLPIWRSGGGCVGNETSLLDCPEPSWQIQPTFYAPYNTIDLSCTSGSDPGAPPPAELVQPEFAIWLQ